jgi:hypothetical protein
MRYPNQFLRLSPPRGILVALVALLALTMISGCKDRTSWRQKLTVTVITPAGEVSGSAVVEVRWTGPNKVILRNLDGGSLELTRGEATAVEVLPGRWLFALLDDQERFLLSHHQRGRATMMQAARRLRADKIGVTLTPEIPPGTFLRLFPTLVTFDDITDPKTVQLVDPADLEAAFGAGVRLKSVTLVATNERVIEGRLEPLLAWWFDMRAGPYNELAQLRAPNTSPRGWRGLNALQFWSHGQLRDLMEKYDR